MENLNKKIQNREFKISLNLSQNKESLYIFYEWAFHISQKFYIIKNPNSINSQLSYETYMDVQKQFLAKPHFE